jgi:hypothetical protein
MSWGIMGFILYRNCYELERHDAISCRSGDIDNPYVAEYRNYSVVFLPVGIPLGIILYRNLCELGFHWELFYIEICVSWDSIGNYSI